MHRLLLGTLATALLTPSSAIAAPRQALLLVWNSRDAGVASRHKGMVELIKEKRAEGHFAGLSLESRVNVYDLSLPAHAAALANLGLSNQSLPLLCVTTVDGRGIPLAVVWKTGYTAPDPAVASLDKQLGIAGRGGPTQPPWIVVVGSDDQPGVSEATAKLRALRADSWKSVPLGAEPKLQDQLGDVPRPGVALLDPGTQKVYWKKPLDTPDGVLAALGQRLGVTYVAPERLTWTRDGSELMRVAGGKVAIGSNQGGPDSKPLHLVELPPYFYLGRTEVTVDQFRRFVNATHYQTDAERSGRSFIFTGKQFANVVGASWLHPKGSGSEPNGSDPVVHMTFNDASAYCSWAGLRLPSEEEWERGTGGKLFPWGGDWAPANLRWSSDGVWGSAGSPVAVGSFPAGASPWGLLDMAGNVAEWTSSMYLPYPGGATLAKMNGLRRVVRGGSWGNEAPGDFYTFKRSGVGTQDAHGAQGFRVCLDGTRF